VDSNGDAFGTTPSATPCANESLTTTANKTVTAGNPSTDYVRFSRDVTASNSHCTSGQQQISAPAGSSVPLTQCVFDAAGNPVQGASVLWFISNGPGQVSPSNGTTDSSGHATATLSKGISGQQTGVDSCVDTNANGTCDVNSQNGPIVVSWTAPRPSSHKSATHLTLGKSSRTRLFGTLSANNTAVCRTGGRLVSLYRDGRLTNQTTTAAGGSFHFRLRKARRSHTFEAKFAGNAHCGASHSNTVSSRAR